MVRSTVAKYSQSRNNRGQCLLRNPRRAFFCNSNSPQKRHPELSPELRPISANLFWMFFVKTPTKSSS